MPTLRLSGKSVFLRSIDNPADCKQYTGHTSQATVARFSPSGFYVASGDAAGTVRVWDAVEAVNTKGEYHIISGRINDVAWDGDSQRIIAVGDGRERFGHCITADSGNSVGEVTGHSKVVNAVAIRQQRPLRAATVSDDGSMCFLHGAPFNQLVTVGADKKIQFYDGKTGEVTFSIGEGEHTGSIFSVSWSQDGKKLVTASADQTVKLWDVEAQRLIQSWRLGPEGAVSIADQQVGVVIPTAGPMPSRVIQGHNKAVTALGAGSDGKGRTLWTGSFDGRALHWDIVSGEGTAVDGQSHSNQVVKFAPGTGRTYSAGWDDTLRTIDEASQTFIGSAVKLSAQPKDLASGNGRVYVATVAGIATYDDGKLVKEVALGYAPTAVAAHGSYVAVGADENRVLVYKASSDGSLDQIHALTKSTSQISTLAFSKDGVHLAAGNAIGKIFVYKTSGSWEVATDRWSAHTARVTTIAWNDEGTHAASGALDTNIHVWSLAKPGSRVKAGNAHKDGVNGLAWIEGKLASSGGDAAVKIWNVKLQ
ncbi:unnamed protein product [Parascedosporium putredinis]|uniref:Anaphase-promoting complex subunit 4 WD40 domain-containing protein n=1 Tax=Parascedosporium putredinis TaxID=1442378 RepID=A0A9P1MBU1_9PEZI|nr:unnamed protein product [Parascedosporium putredinis]CAI7995427.1 unnamed protein product [Parascedosporium putredinis]